jgi:hypothetical protein
MSFSALLDQTLALQRPTIARDASGGAIRSYNMVAGNLSCAVSPASARIVSDYARRDMLVDHHVYTTADLEALIPGGVRLGDRFTDGKNIYLVKAVKRTANKLVTNEVMYEIDCEKS